MTFLDVFLPLAVWIISIAGIITLFVLIIVAVQELLLDAFGVVEYLIGSAVVVVLLLLMAAIFTGLAFYSQPGVTVLS